MKRKEDQPAERRYPGIIPAVCRAIIRKWINDGFQPAAHGQQDRAENVILRVNGGDRFCILQLVTVLLAALMFNSRGLNDS